MTRPRISIYIAGPITGDPAYMKKFAAAEKELLRLDYAPVNPARILHPLDKAQVDYNVILETCLRLLDTCDGIMFLPGWTDSKGAMAEAVHYLSTHKKRDQIVLTCSLIKDAPPGKDGNYFCLLN